MSETKEERAGGSCMLLVFGTHACKRYCLPKEHHEKCVLRLFAEDVGLSQDALLTLQERAGSWYLETGEMLREETPVYYEIDKKERLLLFAAPRQEILKAPGKLFLNPGEVLQMGTDFRSRIFYECGTLTAPRHAEISRTDEGFVLTMLEKEGVYRNERAVEGRVLLQREDRIDLYGLHLLVLKDWLLCVSFCGICRLAESKRELMLQPRALRVPVTHCDKRQNTELLPDLHSGEMELLLPKPLPEEARQPFLLTVGPTLTMVLPILLMAQLSSRYMPGGTGSFYYLSVAMSGCSALLGLFWGMVNLLYRKRVRRRDVKRRSSQYRNYLEETSRLLSGYQEENRQIMELRYPDCEQLLCAKEGAYAVLWNRYPGNQDYLFLPMGRGDIPFQLRLKKSREEPSFTREPLLQEAELLLERFAWLEEVPVGISLAGHRQIGLVGKRYEGELEKVLFRLLVQAAACLCYTELKIVCLYHKEQSAQERVAQFVRWLPHSWSGSRRVRFVAGDEKELAELLPVLTGELERPGEKVWYLILALHEELLRSEALYSGLTNPEGEYPASVVFVAREKEDLPKSCRFYLMKNGEQEEMVVCGKEQVSRQRLVPGAIAIPEALNYARRLTGVQTEKEKENGQLPEMLDFLQLFGCERLEELDSAGRWQRNRPGQRMKLPVGVGLNGNQVFLDIHEKFHGPHGLVAGTTGSGKSELLQTYLLSMAVTFSPADVNFFMIDYKGGGTGNLLQSLPHCAGIISNLSGKQIKRAMSAITSENKRRQLLLSENHVNHIDSYGELYREGRVSEAMPHLILVVDEFAELRKEEPEFMQELISLAQVGRSLGVHLILATQKPAGTVDDKIWSNARFRLCLRVQDRQDSMDMLHKPDAAYLTSPGECYLQIGNHEYYELFRAAYCGGSYQEEGRRKETALLVTNTGRRIGTEEDKEKKRDERTLLEATIHYVNQTAKQEGFKRTRQLWLPELPEKLLLEEVEQRFSEGTAEKEDCQEAVDAVQVLLGLCDDPGRQKQLPLYYRPFQEGHLAFCGGPATGKTTFLQTILWQLLDERYGRQVQVLLVELGQESLSCFGTMPNCLGVLKNRRESEIFFYQLGKMLCKRKQQLGGISFQQYRSLGKGELPAVFLVIDRYGELRGGLEEKQEELLFQVAAEGPSCGMFLILAAAGTGEIQGKVLEKIKTTLALELNDRFLYGDILRQYPIPVLPAENCAGRGLCKVEGRILEFQVPLVKGELDDYARLGWLEEEGNRRCDQMRAKGQVLPAKFPVLPEKPDMHVLLASYGEKREGIPLGYLLQSGEPAALHPAFGSCFLIAGEACTGKRTLLRCLGKSLAFAGYEVLVADFEGRLGGVEKESWAQVLFGWEPLLKRLRSPVRKKSALLIASLTDFCHHLYGSELSGRETVSLVEQAVAGKGSIAFWAGAYEEKDYETEASSFFKSFISGQQGIYLGKNAAQQRYFDFEDLGYATLSRREPVGIGYYKAGADAETRRVLLPEYERKETDGFGGYSGADAGSDL